MIKKPFTFLDKAALSKEFREDRYVRQQSEPSHYWLNVFAFATWSVFD